MEFQYSEQNVINIFTDASTSNNPTGQSIGFVCSGFIAVQNDFVIGTDYRVLNGCTSQFGELYAIMMGLTFMNRDVWGKRYTGRALEVDFSVYNLISDSLYSLTCLRKTLSEWVKFTNQAVERYRHPTFNYFNQNPTPPDLLKPNVRDDAFSFMERRTKSKKEKNKRKHHKEKSDSLMVADQEVLLHCMGLIVHNQKPINTYHIKGHLSEFSNKGIDIAREAFVKYNNSIKPKDEELKSMIHWNNRVDESTRTHLKTILAYDRNLPNTVNWPVRYYPTQEHQAMYQNLIR